MGSRENLKLAVTVMAGGECMLPNFFFFFFLRYPVPWPDPQFNSTIASPHHDSNKRQSNGRRSGTTTPRAPKTTSKIHDPSPEVSFPQPSSRQTSSGTQGASPTTPLDSLTDGGIPAQLPGLVLVPEPALVRVCDLVQVRPYDRSAKVPSDAPTRLLGVFGTHA